MKIFLAFLVLFKLNFSEAASLLQSYPPSPVKARIANFLEVSEPGFYLKTAQAARDEVKRHPIDPKVKDLQLRLLSSPLQFNRLTSSDRKTLQASVDERAAYISGAFKMTPLPCGQRKVPRGSIGDLFSLQSAFELDLISHLASGDVSSAKNHIQYALKNLDCSPMLVDQALAWSHLKRTAKILGSFNFEKALQPQVDELYEAISKVDPAEQARSAVFNELVWALDLLSSGHLSSATFKVEPLSTYGSWTSLWANLFKEGTSAEPSNADFTRVDLLLQNITKAQTPDLIQKSYETFRSATFEDIFKVTRPVAEWNSAQDLLDAEKIRAVTSRLRSDAVFRAELRRRLTSRADHRGLVVDSLIATDLWPNFDAHLRKFQISKRQIVEALKPETR